MKKPLWSPSPELLSSSNMARFIQQINQLYFEEIESYDGLYRWSIDHIDLFWQAIWNFCGVIGKSGGRLLIKENQMPGARFFPDARLNFAENLLAKNDQSDAIVFRGEDQVQTRMSWAELNEAVSLMSQALRAQGVTAGDRIAAFMPNTPETVVAMLATASVGAVWCSCSPDYGTHGVLDRFRQIEPKVLIACDGYFYQGKRIDILPKLAEVVAGLHSVERVVVVPYLRAGRTEELNLGEVAKAQLFDDFTSGFAPAKVEVDRFPFNHPLYILFSSGTTGAPKCIVHSAGGTLLQHLKEHQLHCDIQPGDRLFYFTTCTWMMWNWLVSSLASGATLLLYDGAPFHPDDNVLFDYADAEAMTHFGTSAKYIETLNKRKVYPNQTHQLKPLRMMLSTGSPLVPESFDFVYEHIKSNIYLASIAGGSDIVSCFVLGTPLKPVYRGEIACRGLGMAVEVWNENGRAVEQEKGELVCTKPFPSMPIGFWKDQGDKKYKSAYFDPYDNIWVHGDFAEITEVGGVIIYGRSDATLNPGGVRIGSAEIYRQVDQFNDVMQSIVIGQSWENDVRIVLFVVLREGLTLSEELISAIKQQIRIRASPRHVPAKVIQVGDIPVTKSGKIAELPVRDVVEGREVSNTTALANPDSLDLFKDLPELRV